MASSGPGERPAEGGAAREQEEETGLLVDPEHLRLAYTVLHRQDPTTLRLGLFFVAADDLPEGLIPYPAAGIRGALSDPGGLLHHNWPV